MKKQTIFIIVMGISLSILFACSLIPIGKGDSLVKYPKDYREWTYIKSMVIQKGNSLYDSFGGIHHIYANKKALKAMKKGKPFSNGSVLVFDLLEARIENNAVVEGPRKFIGVMERNTKKYAETGGWGFEAFEDDTTQRMVKDPKSQCFSCHEAQKDKWYVFTTYHQ